MAEVAQPAAGLGAELSDAALVGLYRDGGGDFAFGELIRRHQIGIFRLLLTILADPDQAERLCEQTFFDAARKLDELTDPANFYAWVAGIARGLAQKIDDERKKTRVAPRPRPAPKNPRDAVKRGVQAVLSELANDERVALVLADLEGDSYESIGKTLGTTAAEAEAMVERARERFIGAFAEQSEQEDVPPPSTGGKHELALGTVLGNRFRLEAKLGEGGMGLVFRAKDEDTGRDVAVKTLLPEAAKDAALRKRFELEATLIEKLAHPNFVRFIGHGGGGKSEPAYVVMEFVDGSALDRLLKAESRLRPKRALHIASHVLTGLGWAHEQGVVHRDIKPENVVLVNAGDDPDFAKILDLGIARMLAPKDEVEKTRLTQKGEIFGTPVYMSPEQVQGEDVDGRSDLYSLSVMLFELIAARPPFQAKNSTALFAMHLATPAPRLSEVAPELKVPSALEALLERGLAKDPAQRLASAKDYLSEVQALISADWELSEQITAPRSAERRAPAAAPAAAAGKPRQAPAALREPKPAANRRGLRRLPLGVSLLIIAAVLWALWQGFQMIRD